MDGILPLVDLDLNQSLTSISSETCNLSISTAEVSNL